MGVYQYENNVLNFFPHAEGYVTKEGSSTYRHVFTFTDHLGNIRLKYCDLNQNGSIETNEILEENHYYPFGLKHEGYNGDVLALANKYKYNGNEWQDELGLNFYDYGARNYNPAIGRWMNIDPLAEMSRRWTPYNYTYNNPIYFVDPDGMQVEVAKGLTSDDWKDKEGRELTKEERKNVKHYIFYDPKPNGENGGFPKQALAQYDTLVEKYGEGSVALSDANTEAEFAKDWGDMDGAPESITLNNYGTNQALHLDAEKGEYIVSTGNGKTNVSGTAGTNVSDLPTPAADLSNTILILNTCNSNNTTQPLAGTKETLAVSFSKTGVDKVRGTNRKLNINENTGRATIPVSQAVKGGVWQYFRNGKQYNPQSSIQFPTGPKL